MTIRGFLCLAVCLSGLGCRPANSSHPVDPAPSAGDPPAAEARPAAVPTVVYAYYFHQTFRCMSCEKMEETAARAIEEHLGPQIKTGQVVWRPVNIDKPEGKVLRQQFNVQASDLVLARMENGRCKEFRKLDELAGLTDRPDAFSKYLVDQIDACLSSAQGR
jgi:hypothetical protein